MKKIIAGMAVAIISLSGAVSAQDNTTPAFKTYNKQYQTLPGYVDKVIADPDTSRNPFEVAVERDVCDGSKVLSARWRDDLVLAVRCPVGAVVGGLPGALGGTALTTGAAVGLVAVVTVLAIASGGDGDGTTTTTSSGTN